MPHLPTIFDHLEPYVVAPIATLVLTVVLLALMALAISASLAKDPGLVPSERLTLRNFLEILLEGMAGQMEAAIGPEWHRYVPLICTLGLFILISNLTGLIPFFTGPTSFVETNLAWAVISFVSYNVVGIRHHGLAYFKRFLGPVPLLIPLMLPIEIINHLARMLSLTLRLTANMFADHTLVAIFVTMPLVGFFVPWVVMGLGLFVGFLQAFIFSYWTVVFIGEALEEAH